MKGSSSSTSSNSNNSSKDNKEPKAPTRALLMERLQEADSKSKSKTTTVTLRIPTELNDWLDEYRHLSYPQRIEKQALVIEGLRLLYMARGQPGSDAFNLEEVLLSKASGRSVGKSKRK
jgi:hypothetical protein